jgi:hypothetical protein
MKRILLGSIFFAGCIFETENPIPPNTYYVANITITNYYNFDDKSIFLIESDTLNVSSENSYWYHQLAGLKVTEDSCEANFKEIWWDYDYGMSDSSMVVGKRNSNTCLEFGSGRLEKLHIKLGADKIRAYVRFMNIPYDSLEDSGLRRSNFIQIVLDEKEVPYKIKARMDAELKEKGLYNKFYGIEANPEFYDDGLRVFKARLYENITFLIPKEGNTNAESE